MKLATIRTQDATRAAVVVGDELCEVGGKSDVGELLVDPNWRTLARQANGPRHPISTADFAPLVVRPDKIFCVGLNYRSHIEEMGNVVPEFPTLFAKFTGSLIGANDSIALPVESDRVDWEVELAVVIGRRVRRASPSEARAAIAGYTVVNDISMRDWQRRTVEFLRGRRSSTRLLSARTCWSTTPMARFPSSTSAVRSTVCSSNRRTRPTWSSIRSASCSTARPSSRSSRAMSLPRVRRAASVQLERHRNSCAPGQWC